MEKERPKVGIGVLVFKDGKVLLGRRKNAHGAGEYAGPGGHLEHGETFESCAKREVFEEAGIEIDNPRFLCVSNFKIDGKHYVDIGFASDWKSGEPYVYEPEKCENWGWYDINNLPKPLFEMDINYIHALKTGQAYYDK